MAAIFMPRLVHRSSGCVMLLEDCCYERPIEVIEQLPRSENGYDAIFELVSAGHSPGDWEVRFQMEAPDGAIPVEMEDFRPLAEDR